MHGLDEAIDLAARSGSMLRLMHVVGASKYLRGDGGSAELIACMPESAGQVLRPGRARAQAAGIAAETLLLTTSAADVVDLAAEQAVT